MRRDLIALPDSAKVWIYQADRFVDDRTAEALQERIIGFTEHWLSHGQRVPAYGHFFHKRFLVLLADDSAHVSGCSIDASVHFVQKLSEDFALDFFDRLNFIYFNEEGLSSIHHSNIEEALENGLIHGETLFFNNLVKNKKEFIDNWVSPMNQCWMQRYLKATV